MGRGTIDGQGIDEKRTALAVAYAKTAPMRTSRSLPPRPCQIWHED
jgi:hypothetical protein